MDQAKPPVNTFAYGPLGPWSAEDGNDYCCGLLCGKPCPYGLRMQPKSGKE